MDSSRKEKVAVIGLGVGYAVACTLAHAGYSVTGLDLNPSALASPRRDKSLDVFFNDRRERSKIDRNLGLTTDYQEIAKSDIAIICVSTGDERKLELGNVEQAVRSCLRVMRGNRRGPVLLVYSTLPLGSSKRIRDIFRDEKVAIDDEVGYCHMPLMIAQGTTANDFVNPPFLVFGAYSRKTAERARNFYTNFIGKSILFNGEAPPTYVETPEIAELAKLTANAFLTTKISFANMVAEFCEKLGVRGDRILQIIGSHKTIGGAMLKPGYSFGGACFPRDLNSLIESFAILSPEPLILEATRDINERRIRSPLDIFRREKLGGRVLVLGKTYKAGVKDTRYSPGLRLIELLQDASYHVISYDPNIDSKLSFDKLVKTSRAESVVITTPEPIFRKLGLLLKGTQIKIVLDYANVVELQKIPQRVRLFRAGIGWVSRSHDSP